MRRLGLFQLACLLVIIHQGAKASAEETTATRVMSFNIRYGTAADDDNRWVLRKSFLLQTIKTFEPDLLGTQETLGFQRDYLAENLPEYDHVGVGRNDGKQDGEMTALFYKKDRFAKIEEGHLWLSTSPTTPGSKDWDSALPRMMTWVRLKDLKNARRTILFLNTHFDHIGVTARNESAKLIREMINAKQDNRLVILTGDFNCGEDSEPYRLLFGDDQGQTSPLVDSFRAVHPDRKKDEGTFSGFDPHNVRGARIDWIGVSRGFEMESAEIDRTTKDGKVPSDHFPVIAILK